LVPLIVNEHNIMMQLHHPFVVPILKTYQTSKSICFLLPMYVGGELSSLLKPRHVPNKKKKKENHSINVQNEQREESGDDNPLRMQESHARFYLYCIVIALQYIHKRNVVHRDLKLNNMLLDSLGFPVIADFGLSTVIYPGERSFDYCGTVPYMAPEMIQNAGHDCSVDHWSLGVLLYELLTGVRPFRVPPELNLTQDEEDSYLEQSIVNDDFDDPQGVSSTAIDLVRSLLVKDPARRLGSSSLGQTDHDILNHPWFDGLDRQSIYERKTSLVPWVPSNDEAPTQVVLDFSNYHHCPATNAIPEV
jgi:serine/threonine protein kinase